MSNNLEKEIGREIISLLTEGDSLSKLIEQKSLISGLSIRFCNMPALKVVCTNKKKYIAVNKVFMDILNKYPLLKVETVKSDPWPRVLINSKDDIKQMNSLFSEIYDHAYSITAIEKFDCCSRFEQCSDSKRCVQPDKQLARGCTYRLHLMIG